MDATILDDELISQGSKKITPSSSRSSHWRCTSENTSPSILLTRYPFSEANGHVNQGTIAIKKLQALVHWIKDCQICSLDGNVDDWDDGCKMCMKGTQGQ